MNPHAQEILEIKGILSRIPANKLPEVKELLEPLATEKVANEIESPEGIWAGLGFEEIDDTLEDDIREIRKEADEAILRKEI